MIKIIPEIAELLGAHTGDGTLYRTNKSLVWELRGALNEKGYYINNICPLIKNIFKIDIKSKFRNDGGNGVWGVQTSKKPIIKMLLYYGFKPGTKVYSVDIPQYIFDSNIKVKRSFVRGLFDTDGCLRFDRINKNKLHTYPRIEFSFASFKLIFSLKKLLENLRFTSFTWKSGQRCFSLCLAGKQKSKRWFEEIQPKNPKHLKKYSTWINQGFYP